MVFENGVKNIQAAAYNGARTVNLLFEIKNLNVYDAKYHNQSVVKLRFFSNFIHICTPKHWQEHTLKFLISMGPRVMSCPRS